MAAPGVLQTERSPLLERRAFIMFQDTGGMVLFCAVRILRDHYSSSRMRNVFDLVKERRPVTAKEKHWRNRKFWYPGEISFT